MVSFMSIRYLRTEESRERCAESGWYAFDLILSEGMDDDFIRSRRQVGGSFLYLPQLKQPFFKIESDYYMLKGVRGNDFFRMAVHGEHTDEVRRVEQMLRQNENGD